MLGFYVVMYFVDNGKADNGRATVFLYFVDNGRADNDQQTLFVFF